MNDNGKKIIKNPMPEEEVKKLIEEDKLTVRKLTPLECWRLMSLCPLDRATDKFDDTNYLKGREVCSESQMYKIAGNSIVTDCLEAIFESFLCPKEGSRCQTSLGDF